jgi:hypothetical protein
MEGAVDRNQETALEKQHRPAELTHWLMETSVQLCWKKAYAENWPIVTKYIFGIRGPIDLYAPWYKSNDAKLVDCCREDSKPIKIADVDEYFDLLSEYSKRIIADYEADIAKGTHPETMNSFISYQINDRTELLLDGNHRAVALARSGTAPRITLYSIQGPVDQSVLPDLWHWQRCAPLP